MFTMDEIKKRGGIKSLFRNISATLLIGLIFFIARQVNLQLLTSIAFNDLTQFIYVPAGVRFCAVLIYGWLGVFGIFIGWILSHVIGGEKTLIECIFLGIISGFTAMASFQIGKSVFDINDALHNLNLKKLYALILFCSLISSLIRYLYIYGIDPSIKFHAIFIIGYIGDVLGTFFILYLLRGAAYLKDKFI